MGLKKKLGLAVVTTALGATILAAGSFAIFTSTATNQGNTFTAGTLKISLDKPDGTHYFDIKDIAPGDLDKKAADVVVSNDGSLQLKYNITEALAGKLAEGLNPVAVTIKDSTGAVVDPTAFRVLDPTKNETLSVYYSLPLAADNTYQGAGATFGITVNAAQKANN